MSLVERAAKRLEELGKAGVQAAGDLTYRPSEGQAAPTLIERAVRGFETLDEHDRTIVDVHDRPDDINDFYSIELNGHHYLHVTVTGS